MKSIVAVLFLGAFCFCAAAENNGYRVFMDTQGRAIMLKVVKCDPKHDSVTVEREDGRRLTVKISNFGKSDQDYIKEWFKANELIDEKNLKISFDDVVSRREEDITGSVYIGGGLSDTAKIGSKKYEKVSYKITFENKSSYPIQNARLEYRIYSEQSTRTNKEPKQDVLSKNVDLKVMYSGKKMSFTTDSIEVLNEKYTHSDYDYRNTAEGEVNGIRCRLIVKMSDDKEIVREFCYPSSLSEKKYPWK